MNYMNIKKIFYLFIFRERGSEGEREGEKHQSVVASCAPSTGDLACHPGMYAYWELNLRPSVLQAGAQSTKPHQPGLYEHFEVIKIDLFKDKIDFNS